MKRERKKERDGEERTNTSANRNCSFWAPSRDLGGMSSGMGTVRRRGANEEGRKMERVRVGREGVPVLLLFAVEARRPARC